MKKNSKKEKDALTKIEERIDIDAVTITSLLPFIILCESWKEKNLEFILNNFNALSGYKSWNLLNNFEQEDMYSYLVSRGYEDDERWAEFKENMLNKNSKV